MSAQILNTPPSLSGRLPHLPHLSTVQGSPGQPHWAVGADRMMLSALCIASAASVAIGHEYGQTGLAWASALGLLALGLLVHLAAPGSPLSRTVLALALAGSVATHIQLGRGTLEFHFGVFVTLALLLIYRDWRPIVVAAGFFAVHHVLFDRLQAAGFGVYCTPEPNFLKMVMHAGYVVVQTVLEVGIARGLQQVHAKSDELSRLVAAVTRGPDGGGDTISLDVSRVQTDSRGGQALKQAIARMHAALADVKQAADSILATSQTVSAGNLLLSERTEASASQLAHTAGAVEQLAGSVRSSAEAALEANRLASSAAEVAARGGEVVSAVVATMDEISTSSKKIADIIGVIDGIAFQTNILALNAAVEAARAGEQGRGFAVVAGEVRTLAGRSAQAAREIKALIGESVARTQAGASLVNQAGQTMGEIVASVQRVSDTIGSISLASATQSQDIGQMHTTVESLNSSTQQNAALVEQSTASAESLRQQAHVLSQVVGRFQLSQPG